MSAPWPNFAVLRHKAADEAAQHRKAEAVPGVPAAVAEVPPEKPVPEKPAPEPDEADVKDEARADPQEESLPKPPAMAASTRGPRTKAVPASSDATENT